MLDRATLLVANVLSTIKLSPYSVVFPGAAVVSLTTIHPRVLLNMHISLLRSLQPGRLHECMSARNCG